MSNILINQIWQHKKFEYRILYIDKELDIFIWVRLNEGKYIFPEELSFTHFLTMVDSESVTVTSYEDNLINTEFLEEKSIQKMEDSWEMIKEVVNQEPQIFDKKIFNKQCNKIAEAHNVSRQTISRLMHKFWVNGKTKNGLAPKYYNSGGKGKEKNFDEVLNGRRSLVNDQSMILDRNTKRKISKGYKRWYLDIQEASLKKAWINFIRTSYKNKGKKIYPSYNQFIYWGSKDYSEEIKLVSNEGQINFDKDIRSKEGSSYNSCSGPGLSQIDSTPGDVVLISDLDEKELIGSPTIYSIADVFSGVITGITVTLENPSFAVASEALYYSFVNKDQLFNDYLLNDIEGFNLKAEDWPIDYLPNGIVADNGIELVSKNSTRMIENTAIHIENKESYRPELKGLIENTFNLMHQYLKSLDNNLGYKSKNDGRKGARNASRSATFTMREYLAILIKTVVNYNKHQKLVNYPLDPEMFKDGLITPTPLEVFDWGLKNRLGKLRSSKITNLKEKMLPAEQGKFFKDRIEFKKGWYHVPVNKKLNDFKLRLGDKNVKVNVSYNPYNLNSVYFIHENEVYTCNLNIDKSPIHKDKTIWDINHLIHQKSISSSRHDEDALNGAIDVNNFAESLLKKKSKKNNKKSPKINPEERQKTKATERKRRGTLNTNPEENLKKEGKVIPMPKKRNLEAPDDLDLINDLINGK